MVKVYYNGTDPFNGIAPTPFVGVADQMVNYGQRWGVAQTVTLNGIITGSCDNSFNDLINKQNSILNSFATDFGELQIIENDVTHFSGNYARVNNVSFDASAYFRGLNFKVDFTVYPQSLFSGTFGVLDPTSDIKYSEQQDGTVNITRSFSAKGFQTSTSAIQNAVNYVQSLTGTADIITPAFISSIYPSYTNLCPRKITENINRLEGTYAVNIDYILRKNASTSTVLKYTTDFSYDDERGIYNASIKGTLDGGMCKTMQDLQSEYSQLDFYSITLSQFPYGYLNPNPNSISVEENETNNTINFTYSYDSESQDVKVRHNIDISNDYLSDRTEVNFSATFTARGPQKARLAKAEMAAQNFDPLPLCQQYYLQNNTYSVTPLNIYPKNKKITRDLTNGNVTLSASFDNSPMAQVPIKSINYTLSVTPSINKYSPLQFLNGTNGYFDLNYFNRGKISIQGNAILSVSSDQMEFVRSMALGYLNGLADTVKIKNDTRVRSEDKVDRNLRSDMNGYAYTFNLSDTCETPIFTIQ
jgi:hypothetical protein